MNNPQKIKTPFLVIAALSLLAAGGIALLANGGPKRAANTVLPRENAALADAVVSRCRNESSRAACYDREIPKLMDSISMEDAFAVTKIVQDRDPDYRYCHVLGHELSAREVKKKPNDWKTVIARCPSGVCSNGCIHGGLQERFRRESLTDAEAEEILPDLRTLCEQKPNWNPTGLERGSCYHALGHLTMYMTNGDIAKSAALCGKITQHSPGEAFSHVCLDGAFMQIFQPLEPEDFALIKGKQPTKETFGAFCAPFAGEAKGSCISEAWPLFAEEVRTPQGLIAFCGREEPAEKDRCYDGMAYVLTVQLGFNADALHELCKGLPRERRGQCASQVASRLIETDYRNISSAVQFCADSASYDPAEVCFRNMASQAEFTFHARSSEFHELCAALPERWKQKCVSAETPPATN